MVNFTRRNQLGAIDDENLKQTNKTTVVLNPLINGDF